MKLSTFLQMRCNTTLYRRMTWNGVFAYIYLLCGFYFLLNRKERENIECSVRHVLQCSPKGIGEEDVLRRVFKGIVSHYYEKLFNAYADASTWREFFRGSIHAPNFGLFHEELQKGRGVLFVTGHYGGIEYIPIYIAMSGCPISVVASFATSELKEALEQRTRGLGLRIIDAKEKGNVARAILKELRDNRVVFFECDEIDKWKPARKESMAFLGRTIHVDRTISLLQKRSGASIIFGLLHRSNLRKYFMILETYREVAQNIQATDRDSPGKCLLKRLEDYIYSSPEQWYQWKEYPKLGKSCFSGL